MSNRSVNIGVGLDTKGVATGTQRIQGELQKLSGSVKSITSSFSMLSGALIGGAAVGKFTDFIKDSILAASDLNETMTKAQTIFGDAAEAIFKFADNAVYALGQTKQQAIDAATTFAIFGKSAGLSGDELAKFSTDLVSLSADFASFFNTSPDEAITAIGSALRGEAEPLRRFGILLDDATLRSKALEMGIVSTTKNALTPQQKVLAANAVIFSQSKDAQGDFARTQTGLANATRKLNAQFSELGVTIGQELLPTMENFANKLANVFEAVNKQGIAATAQIEGLKLLMSKELNLSSGWKKLLGVGLATFGYFAGNTPEAATEPTDGKVAPNMLQGVKLGGIGTNSTVKLLTEEEKKILEAKRKAAAAAHKLDLEQSALRKEALQTLISDVSNSAEKINSVYKDNSIALEKTTDAWGNTLVTSIHKNLSEVSALTTEFATANPIGFIREPMMQVVSDIKELTGMVNDAIEQFVVQTAVGLFGAIGEAIGGGGDALKKFGQDFLGEFGGFLQQVGGMIIAYGFAMEAFQKAFTNPFAAIAAGAALIIIGGAIKGAHEKKFGGGGSGGGMSGGYGGGPSYSSGLQDNIIYSRLDGRDLVLSNQRTGYTNGR
jgi:hypothetical protein